MMKRIIQIFHRPPDFIIGSKENPYLLRWWIVPRNRFLNIYLHNFLSSDEDRALHDHPWWSCSIILRGGYREHFPGGIVKRRWPGMMIFRRATQAHRVELLDSDYFWSLEYPQRLPIKKSAWTLFITGRKVREWGFHCPQGWTHWRNFIGVPHGEARGDETGRGCE